MNWEFEKIPKKLFLYWGKNKPLSFMRYLTAVSFSKRNPDWDICIYYPYKSSNQTMWVTGEQHSIAPKGYPDYFSELEKLPNVSVEAFSFSSSLGIKKRLSEVQRSDILRWYLLSSSGGVWSDFDIFYLLPIETLVLAESFDADVVLCKYKKGRRVIHPIAFVMGGEGAGQGFYASVLDNALDAIKHKKLRERYQAFGREVLEDTLVDLEKESYSSDLVIGYIPETAVYPLLASQTFIYYQSAPLRLPEQTIGLHWCAGHKASGNVEYTVTKQNIKERAATSWLLRRMAKYAAEDQI